MLRVRLMCVRMRTVSSASRLLSSPQGEGVNALQEEEEEEEDGFKREIQRG